MRTLALLLAASAAGLAWPVAARAQVTDAERAAARELFKEGDELQRAGKFAEALDKFQRAQQVFSAPTNMLRIAECDAALGRLVESAESYRAVVRTPLPAGSPAAFQSAVDQAKGELAQVEPRVPKLIVQVEPSGVPNEQMQIDGQTVPAALIGEPIPLDPGTHKILVFAPGYASAEQPVTLHERDSKTLPVTMRPISGVTYAPGGSAAPPPPVYGAGPAPAAGSGNIPPPPPPVEGVTPVAEKRSRTGFVFGLHLGAELPSGNIPLPAAAVTTNPNPSASDVSSGGFVYGLDAGLRFARNWIVGLTLDHASLGQGHDPAQINPSTVKVTSDTSMLGVNIAIVGNPDRTSFYGELGLDERWYGFTYTDASGHSVSNSYNSGELNLGLGIWIPVGHAVRLLPEATVALGVFNPPNDNGGSSSSNSSNGQSHAFFMLGMSGFYNLEL